MTQWEEQLQQLHRMDLDENGQKVYDLVTKTVTATLNQDLELTLFDNADQTPVKVLPKQGTDPTALAISEAELMVLKKQIRAVVSRRREWLLAEFLEEMPQTVEAWRRTYTTHPLMRAMARLVVWKQGSITFLPDGAGSPILSTGEHYTLTGDFISVAHPREMDPADVKRWQEYFHSHGLVQLFDQLQEPVYSLEAISPDRYRDCILYSCYLLTSAQHGITVIEVHGDNGLRCGAALRLRDCTLECRGGLAALYGEALFTLGTFRVEKPSRAANHVVFMLDKWTLHERIARDDVTIVTMLKDMPAAQVTEALNLAIRKQAIACTAALLELKNTRFPGGDTECLL